MNIILFVNRDFETNLAYNPLKKERSLFWHIIRQYPMGCKLILESIQKLKTTRRLRSTKQNMREGNYFSLPKEEDFQILNNRGIESFNSNDYKELIGEYISPKVINKLEIKKEYATYARPL